MLQSYGFTTAVFGSAEQFLSSSHPRNEAYLIVDIRMPGMTGLGLYRRLTSEGCRVPIILITGSPTKDERERAMTIGVFSYLPKPVNESVLIETLCKALQHGNQAAD